MTKKEDEIIKKLSTEGYKELRKEKNLFNKFIDENPELEKLFSVENFKEYIKSPKFQFLYIQQVIKGSIESQGIKGLIENIEKHDGSLREIVKNMVEMKKQLNMIEDYIKNMKSEGDDSTSGLLAGFS